MFRFFRQIRVKLLRENQTGRYLKYAVGEIVLVVIGILIAVQINNWNQDRKDDRIVKEYLVKIKSHTMEDLHQLDTMTMYRTQLARLCKRARIRMLHKDGR